MCGLPLTVLVVVWLWFVFSSGGLLPRQWLLPSLCLGLIGVLVSVLLTYPRRPRQVSLLVLGVFGAYGLWTAFSSVWADSAGRALLEGGRTFSYLAFFAVAMVYLTSPAARRLFRYLVMGSAVFILFACIWRLWSSHDAGALFSMGRLSYPVASPAGSAALFLVFFWPLIWLAAGSGERAPVRGAAAGLATGLLGLAVMTHSREALWSLGASAVIMFVISPARLRTLFYTVVPGLLMVYEFPNLNRFWKEGAEALGGAAGARTLLVATVTAAFMGMILALLERWVKVSRRMKTVFGSIIFLGVAAAIVYGAIVTTSDAGGPVEWLSRNWTDFTQQPVGQVPQPIDGVDSLSPTGETPAGGRGDVWSVAWQAFQAKPVTGVGADGFVFAYDRLRTSAASAPEHTHSLFLQVLAETGIIGALLFAAGLLLSVGALLWPRCTAGWRRTRQTWLRPDRPLDDRVCNPHWGADPQSYGWQMALLSALAYWLIHGSVDCVWQATAASMAALLFLAAGLAEVDARVDVLWPRVSAFLRMWNSYGDGRPALRPAGLLSVVFRMSLVVLSAALIILAALPYLALQFQESATALAKTDAAGAVDRAGTAYRLWPAGPGPFLTRAFIFESAAEKAASSDQMDRSGAVLDNLALAVDALERAAAVEPADWSLRYQAAIATVDLLLATQHARGQGGQLESSSLAPDIPGLYDWSGLAGAGEAPAAGESAGSLAGSKEYAATAHRLRSLSQQQLAEAALDHLAFAKRLDPLSPRLTEAVTLVRAILDQ